MRQGDTITPYYDPMIAKLIVWGRDRPEAMARIQEALGASRSEGIKNNIEFLKVVIRHEAFISGRIDTGLIDRARTALLVPMASTSMR